MADNVDDLTLEHMKTFQATPDSMQYDIRELKLRQSETHTAVLGLRRDLVSDADVTDICRCSDRLDRIERRLDLTN